MATVKPFRGYRYRLNSPSELDNFIAPPYDMLDSKMVDDLYAKHALNTVRVTQNRPESTDKVNKDRHGRAAQFLNRWISEGILGRENEPSMYVYEQKFSIDKDGTSKEYYRTGVILAVELVEFEKKVVLPHEYTLSGPKQDRYELMETTHANTGQIFGLVPDQGDLYDLILKSRTGKPVGVSTDANGVEHRLYVCSDSGLITKITAAMKDRSILIADGHHRYETALRFFKDTGDPACASVMMTLVSMADPGLVIRPFHRLIRKSEKVQSLPVSVLTRFFDIGAPLSMEDKSVFDFLKGTVEGDLLFIDRLSRELYPLKLNADGEAYLAEAFPEMSATWRHLNVSEINALIIQKIMELPLDGKVLHDIVNYYNDASEALRQFVNDQDYIGGFFIRPLSIDTVKTIVDGGERMPQKSTNFYPKLYSGLVFRKLDEA